MIRLFISVILLFNFTFASPLSFAKEADYMTDYKKALQKAKKEDKPIMAIFVTHMCPWCKKLEKQTLQKPQVDSFIKSNFISLILDKEKSSFPKIFEPKVVPTTLFIRPKEQKKFGEILGYKNQQEYMKLLQKAKQRY